MIYTKQEKNATIRRTIRYLFSTKLSSYCEKAISHKKYLLQKVKYGADVSYVCMNKSIKVIGNLKLVLNGTVYMELRVSFIMFAKYKMCVFFPL